MYLLLLRNPKNRRGRCPVDSYLQIVYKKPEDIVKCRME